jgi:hypothetical protein
MEKPPTSRPGFSGAGKPQGKPSGGGIEKIEQAKASL